MITPQQKFELFAATTTGDITRFKTALHAILGASHTLEQAAQLINSLYDLHGDGILHCAVKARKTAFLVFLVEQYPQLKKNVTQEGCLGLKPSDLVGEQDQEMIALLRQKPLPFRPPSQRMIPAPLPPISPPAPPSTAVYQAINRQAWGSF